MDNVRIVENGVESEVASLAYLGINGKKYLFYSLNDFTENGLPKIRITATNNQDNTINDEEWTNIKTVISSLANGIEVPNVEYIPVSLETFNIGQVKKLAVKPELKQAFVDFVKSKFISAPAAPVNNGPVNEQIPFYDQSIDINNTNDQLQDRTVVENAFDKSMVPPVPEAVITQTTPEQPIISEPVNVIETNPVTPVVENNITLEPVNEIKEAKEDNMNNNNEMIKQLKEIVETNMSVIESSLKNIREALKVIDNNNQVSNKTEETAVAATPVVEPVQQIIEPVEPVIESAPVIENTIPVTPVMETPVVEPTPVVETPVVEMAAPIMDAPAIEPTVPVMETPQQFIEPASAIETPASFTEAPQQFVEPAFNQAPAEPNNNFINTTPGMVEPVMMPSDIPVIPSDGAIAQPSAPINNDFMGMSPTNMPVDGNMNQ